MRNLFDFIVKNMLCVSFYFIGNNMLCLYLSKWFFIGNGLLNSASKEISGPISRNGGFIS